MRTGALCALIPHIYYGVGYCVVYFRLGLTTTFKKINESQLHTFFIISSTYINISRSWRLEIFAMKHVQDVYYLSPEMCVIKLEVEGVLAASNMESITEGEELDW